MMEFLLSIEPFWIWLALGCLLLALELLLGSGFLLAIGSAAFATAAVVYARPQITWLWASTLFAGLMILAAFAWWHFVVKRRRRGAAWEPRLNMRGQELVGRKLTLETTLENGHGRVRLGDATWPVRADEDLAAGARVEVVAVDGITLVVRPVAGN